MISTDPTPDKPQLTPHSFVYQRARQIQEHILPKLRSGIAELEEQIVIFETEMKVLEAAAGVIPPDTIPLSELPDMPLEGGAN